MDVVGASFYGEVLTVVLREVAVIGTVAVGTAPRYRPVVVHAELHTTCGGEIDVLSFPSTSRGVVSEVYVTTPTVEVANGTGEVK